VGDWLSKIGKEIQNFSLQLAGESSALPVRLSEQGSLSIRISDPNKDYPYTAKTLAGKIGKNQNWVAKAATVLELKRNPADCCEIKGASGNVANQIV